MKPKAPRSTKVQREADALLEKLGYTEEGVAAAMNGVKLHTWRNRAAAGNGPPRYKLGKKNVHKTAELAEYIARRRVGVAA